MRISSWKQDLAHLTAWIGTWGLAVLTLLVARNALLDLMTWWASRRTAEALQRELLAGQDFGWKIESVALITLLIAASLGAGMAVFLDYHLRKGADKGDLGKRVVRLLCLETAVALIAVSISVLVRWVSV